MFKVFAEICRVGFLLIAVAMFLALPASDAIAQGETPPPNEPEIVPASQEGQRALAGIKRPEAWKANLFAAEPDVANPVAFHVDFSGRMFVCETFRQSQGVEDNRKHMSWLDDDLAAMTIEDRLAYMQKHLGDEISEYTKHDDRIRLIRDSNGDGTADKSTVFAKHFNSIVSGTGAGVLSYRNNVYYTCIPDLWLLRDTNGDDVAEARTNLHTGYGVRFAFRGHDSHGLIVGPDGRLYFSIGDRGVNIKTADGKVVNNESGSVFRCELDGSKLEIIATGLRNPQELAFDDFGNLFTGDNNSDSGDKARWVYIVRGGDTGWRMAYQYLDDRGPFNREKIWHPFHEGQAAYIVPPIENISDGPSGLTFYPGTGLSDEYRNCFFLCDFRGQASNSGVRSFRNKAKGAFFELVDSKQPIWNCLVTDADFGPDGSFYVSDWVSGWEGLNKGHIYRFVDSNRDEDLVTEVKKILADGMAGASEETLVAWLGHVDRRVRMEAQFELVHRKRVAELAKAASSSPNQLARIHGIWGVGQFSRNNDVTTEVADLVKTLLADDDGEIRAQAAKLAGELKLKQLGADLIAQLSDENPRTVYFASMAIGDLQIKDAADAVAAMLEKNNNADPILRHGGIMAIAGINDANIAHELIHHDSPAVRLATTVALRKMKHGSVDHSLADDDQQVVLEAARAIYDVPLVDQLPELSDMIGTKFDDPALLRRIANANFRVGKEANLENVIHFIAREELPEVVRLDAVAMISEWVEPSGRDRLLGMWRPLENRDAEMVAATVRDNLKTLMATSDPIRLAAIEAAASLGISEVADELVKVAGNKDYDPSARADAIRSLESLEYGSLAGELEKYVADEKPAVRSAARDVMSRVNPEGAIKLLSEVLESGEGAEQQAAFKTVGAMQTPENKGLVTDLVATGLEKLSAGSLAPSAQLDLLMAAEKSEDARVKELLKKYADSKPTDDPLAAYSETLHGGNAGLGAEIFYNRTDVSCQRCHRIDGSGGKVGPDLSRIGVDKMRDYLLESIVLPNKTIAKGFETTIVDTFDGLTFSGIVTLETEDTLTLIDNDAKTRSIPKADIDERSTGASGMPDDIIKQLSREDLRDLIEFLATRKSDPPKEEAHEE